MELPFGPAVAALTVDLVVDLPNILEAALAGRAGCAQIAGKMVAQAPVPGRLQIVAVKIQEGVLIVSNQSFCRVGNNLLAPWLPVHINPRTEDSVTVVALGTRAGD